MIFSSCVKMKFISGIVFLTVWVFAIAHDDLSKNKHATQSTTALSSTDDFMAGNAVDRDITTCMKTNSIGTSSVDKTMWWRVDLGGVYNIYSVNIQFKNYEGFEMRQRGRAAGFSLFVSNNGSTDSSHLCYKNGPELPSLNFTTTCITSGRYVTFYNERLDGVTYPERYETATVYNSLCEVIVKGCKTSGVYGNRCEQQCPTNCKNNVCNIQKGTCFGCEPGWNGTTCNSKCRAWYGTGCKQQCSGHCRDNVVCNHVTGQCDGGCAAGWKGSECNIECEDGTYGNKCFHNCSGNCLNDSPCNRETGHCEGGCKPGFTNTFCNKPCQSGYYGIKCERSCSGHCFNKLVCNHIDGTCSDGCEAGHIGKLCHDPCRDGYYGKDCLSVCSPNCRTCKHTDGTCSCYAGWRKPDCTIACSNSYGENCQYPCSPFCINQTCDRFNGTCLTSCRYKSYGDKCIAGEKEILPQKCDITEIRNEYESPVSNRIPEIVGGTLCACAIFVVSVALFLKRRMRLHMSGTTDSLYANIEIRQSENLTYQQLNGTELRTDNINQQQHMLALESGNTYQQLNVSELEPNNIYQQLRGSALYLGSNYQQHRVLDLVSDNAYQNVSLQ